MAERGPEPRTTPTRRGATYILVLSTAMIVTVLSMSALAVARIRLRTAAGAEDAMTAQFAARSYAEITMLRLAGDADWRTTHLNGQWTNSEVVGAGKFSYKLVDEEDGVLANDPFDSVRLHAKATAGNATRIYSLQLEPGPSADAGTETAEIQLLDYSPMEDPGPEAVRADRWCAQHFSPALPPGTTEWRITRVQFRAKAAGVSADDTIVQLRLPLANQWPSDTVVDQVVLPESMLTDSYAWVERTFANAGGLSPSRGICLCFTSFAVENSARIQHDASDATLANGRFIESDAPPVWDQDDTDQAVYLRVFGTATTVAPGPLAPVPGTWRREEQ